MKRYKQVLTVDEMLDYKNSKCNDEVLYAGQLPLKKLSFTLNGGYRVYHNGNVAYDGMDSYWAIDIYNNL